MKLKQFDPPAFLDTFDDIPHQRDAWDDFVSQAFDSAIPAHSQYYNAKNVDTPDAHIDVPITWLGFPRTIKITNPGDYEAAEIMRPLGGGALSTLLYRPQDEYCEWRVTRDGSGTITSVTFTSEAPEFWSALGNGYPSSFYFNSVHHQPAKGSRKKLVGLYKSLVSADVKEDDLFFQDNSLEQAGFKKGEYNPYNKWNTTQGIMHLTHPANTLGAEIQLGSDATRLYRRDQRFLVDADELITIANFGGVNRSSDPNIGFSVNQVARLGAMITIANPVALYMRSLNTAGWTKPDGKTPVGDYWKIVRGSPNMILRATYEVPKSEGFRVGDILIAGVPIKHGGQIADNITVTLTGRAFLPNRAALPPITGKYLPARIKANPEELTNYKATDAPPANAEPMQPGIGVVMALPPAPPHAMIEAAAIAAVAEEEAPLPIAGKRSIH